MAGDEILGRMTEVFRRVFDDKALTLTPRTTSDDIPGWDSMSNITLAIELEESFRIRIKTAEMETLRNVGDLITLIRSHTAVPAR